MEKGGKERTQGRKKEDKEESWKERKDATFRRHAGYSNIEMWGLKCLKCLIITPVYGGFYSLIRQSSDSYQHLFELQV